MSNFDKAIRVPKFGNEISFKKSMNNVLKHLKTNDIQLDIFGLRTIVSNDFEDEAIVETGGLEKASGGILASQGVIGSLNRVNGATDKMARVVLKANTTGEFQFPSIVLPGDLDDGENMIVKLITQVATGGTDTPTIDIQAFFGVGDTECGAATAALSATKAVRSATILAADIPAAPESLAIILVPAAHANDAIWIYGAWIEYTRKGV